MIANVLLFIVYTGVGMVGEWLYVRSGQESFSIVSLSAMCQSSAVPIACVVNWWLLRMRNSAKRILSGVGLGLLVCAIAFIPHLLIQVYVRLAFGGTL